MIDAIIMGAIVCGTVVGGVKLLLAVAQRTENAVKLTVKRRRDFVRREMREATNER